MSDDLIQGISYALPPVLGDTIFRFMRKALSPEPSSDANPDRFDNLLAAHLVNPAIPDKCVAVLDLGCGDLLLLQKIKSMCIAQETGDTVRGPVFLESDLGVPVQFVAQRDDFRKHLANCDGDIIVHGVSRPLEKLPGTTDYTDAAD